ncbi:MAG: ferrous iron transport protein B [Bryobacterales bacterium]|nr:ferrous iron transport protein B [Bryobacteraceae bacterium]MDW8129447.1 ferrous iron transport protein B [Bryobacterales bacterium]
MNGACHCQTCALAGGPGRPAGKPTIVAIVGPPNSGKSTLFNRLTGLRQKVANYPGVTVEQRVGKTRVAHGHEITLVDLPGIYSLTPGSEDERIAHDVLTGRMPGMPKPDAVLIVLDANLLSRHLMVAAPVLALGLPSMVVLNMADELSERAGQVDVEALSEHLGAPVALISAAKGEGLGPVLEFLDGKLHAAAPRLDRALLNDIPRCRLWAQHVGSQTWKPPSPPVWTQRLDRIFLHPRAGPLVFLAVVVAVFQTIFLGARPLMDAVQALVDVSGAWMASEIPGEALRSLVVDGIWAGVGSVVVFLPQILLLFLFIGILEDSGYLARAALIADRTMARVGLQGKSFIPLISAYACAVPAILATRTIENRRDRIATILIAPLMTCSARLPVYTLVIAAFIPERALLGPLLGTRAAALLCLYALGFLAAVATAGLLKSAILKSERTPFVLELPPYRRPTLRSLGLRLYDRARVFLTRVGTIILAVSILLWALANLPLEDGARPPIERSYAGRLGRAVEPLIEPLGFNWKIGIGLITSLAAREVIVSTLGTIYGLEGDAASVSLQEAVRRDLSPAGGLALLVFFAFAMQCISTIAVVRRETGSWKWPAVQFLYMGTLAYAGAWITYRIAGLLGS